MASFRTHPLYSNPDDSVSEEQTSEEEAPTESGEDVASPGPSMPGSARPDDSVKPSVPEDGSSQEAEGPLIEVGHLAVSRTARYARLGPLAPTVREVWFVLHGYGQLAADFLRPFAGLEDGHRLFIAPEALSRFYRKGGQGEVGASWMTREDRLHEIEDYLSYLDQLAEQLFTQIDRENVRLHLLGFSQGAETACRWVAEGPFPVDRLTLWGGRIPPDVDLAVHRELFQRAHLTIVLGSQDRTIDEKALVDTEQRLNRHTIPYNTLTYEGGHALDAAVLQALATAW